MTKTKQHSENVSLDRSRVKKLKIEFLKANAEFHFEKQSKKPRTEGDFTFTEKFLNNAYDFLFNELSYIEIEEVKSAPNP